MSPIEIGGGGFDSEQIKRQVIKEILEKAHGKVKRKIESFVCPEHGQSPKLIEGELSQGSSMKYHFCCDALKAQVTGSFQ